MLRYVPRICLLSLKQNHNISIIQSKALSTTSSVSTIEQKEKWDLYAGVLVERLPVVSKTLSPLEKQFQEDLLQVEFEKSLKSNFELQHERDLIQSELIKKGKVEVDLDDSSSKQTVQDLTDAYKEEFKKFEFAPRTTADDTSNNLMSHNRKLEDNLYLLTEHTLGSKKYFLLPQGVRMDGETMCQTAKRVLHETCGDTLKVRFYGNAPCGFYKYKYPSIARKEAVGAKVFFFRAALQHGNVDAKVNKNFKWLEKSTLKNTLQYVSYNESVQKFLL